MDKRVVQEWYDIRVEVTFPQEISRERHPQPYQNRSKIARAKLEIVSWTDCFKRGCWRRTHVGIGLMFFQQFVGINALIYYGPTLLQTMGLDRSMQLIISGVLNITQLVGVSSSVWSMDWFGRRPLLLWGSAPMFVSHFVTAMLVALGASWGPMPWAMPAEIFPSSLRAKGVALSTCSNWLNNSIIGIITPPLVQNTGFGACVFFAVFCLFSGIWTFFFVPETMRRTLEQMDHVFKDVRGEEELAKKRFEEAIVAKGDAPAYA
ncbi:major facilitator superfamily domain-containing protein [Cryomyces antarcticus]|uniref:Major facilitator superfamily (MFS) profile domain-containing protein n=1 Tax=Cryomyces antarcticus TaxID=329879 RepID=A0ABR0M864_9PEZI|nr:hypothetical protein LTR60_002641 [Cryomyces antarcticus]KAK5016293.1 hypothetical protein LTR39_002160 [Cryomyces antarcticus]KAK5145127.1 hypothetical protein LTR04_001395 [Oleoguttula sp. CCFEE 6159]KAK5294398.1 hypothetical protein LTR16_001398 [Cryomyces antarcticus]